MGVQKINDDVAEHRRLFVRLPFKKLFGVRQYRLTFIYLLVLVAYVLGSAYFYGVHVVNERFWLVVSCTVVLLISLLACLDVIAQVRSDFIAATTGIEKPEAGSFAMGLQHQEQQWFLRRYDCTPRKLSKKAIALEQEWERWQAICSKAAPDPSLIFKSFYFAIPEAGRFMTLLVGFFAVITTLIITLGASEESYYALIDDWRGYLRFVGLATFLVAYAALPLLGLVAMLREMFWGVTDYLDGVAISERGFYRYIRHMTWSHGVVQPQEVKERAKTIDDVLGFFLLPPGEALLKTVRGAGVSIMRLPFPVHFLWGFILLWILC